MRFPFKCAKASWALAEAKRPDQFQGFTHKAYPFFSLRALQLPGAFAYV